MTKKIFSLTNEDARENRRRNLLVIGGILLFLLAAIIVLLVFFIPRYVGGSRRECRKQFYGLDSFVCVCSAEYCDEIEEVGELESDQMVYFLTSREEHRLQRFSVKKSSEATNPGDMEIRVNASIPFQSIMGFGGAFTDADGIVMDSLNPRAKQMLLNAYFNWKDGIRYTIGRVPIASTDFSTRIYSYADTEGDFEMKTFGLAVEDLEYKIPNIIEARKMVGDQFRLYATPWSPPWWMKESGKMAGGGPIKGKVVGGDDKYYRAYAKYLRLFFEEYARRNVHFWAMTIENEPSIQIDRHYWQALMMSPETERQFAYHLLSPELKKSEVTKNLKIMAMDEQRKRIGDGAKTIYSNETESAVIDGLAVHWYSFSEYAPLQIAHEASPNKFILASEASCGDQANGEFRGPQMGNWTRGWMYGHDILNDMNNWVVGWVDWNLCLDINGGPNWFGNTIDAAIIVNATAQQFYKQPLYYFLAHFSRFIPRDSVHILSKMYDADGEEVQQVDGFFLKEMGLVEHSAFKTPDGHLVLVLLNGDAAEGHTVNIGHGTKQWRIDLPPDSIATAIFRK